MSVPKITLSFAQVLSFKQVFFGGEVMEYRLAVFTDSLREFNFSQSTYNMLMLLKQHGLKSYA